MHNLPIIAPTPGQASLVNLQKNPVNENLNRRTSPPIPVESRVSSTSFLQTRRSGPVINSKRPSLSVNGYRTSFASPEDYKKRNLGATSFKPNRFNAFGDFETCYIKKHQAKQKQLSCEYMRESRIAISNFAYSIFVIQDIDKQIQKWKLKHKIAELSKRLNISSDQFESEASVLADIIIRLQAKKISIKPLEKLYQEMESVFELSGKKMPEMLAVNSFFLKVKREIKHIAPANMVEKGLFSIESEDWDLSRGAPFLIQAIDAFVKKGKIAEDPRKVIVQKIAKMTNLSALVLLQRPVGKVLFSIKNMDVLDKIITTARRTRTPILDFLITPACTAIITKGGK